MTDDLIGLAATAATDTGNPLGALTALSELRAALDRVERDQVALALDAGWSWGAIAGALGVSRQAAHKKHRERAADAKPSRPTSLKPGRILVTSEARSAVRNAREEAGRCGVSQVGTEHLLLGILRCEYSAAVRALESIGVTLEAAREAAMPTLTGASADESEPAGDEEAAISPVTRAALEQSLREATHRGDGYLGVEHLLLSLIRDKDSGATRTLAELGITESQLRHALQQATAV